MPDADIRLSNPMRYLVPIGTALLTIIMFVLPVLLAGVGNRKVAAGVCALIVCVLWLARSAWIAPHAATIDAAGVDIRRLAGRRRYAISQLRKWWFAVPDGPPTQEPPPTNGVLYLVLDDRTRFRGEVTAEEAAEIARLLPAAP